jgi:hypothetical protein
MKAKVILIFLFISGTTANKFLEIILNRVENIFETPEVVKWHLNVRKINKTRAVIGYMEYTTTIGDDFKAEYKILKKQGKNCL